MAESKKKRIVGVRHALLIHVDVEVTDQTDETAMIDIVSYWIRTQIQADANLTEIDWPLSWSVRHLGETLIKEDSPEEGTNDGSSEKKPEEPKG